MKKLLLPALMLGAALAGCAEEARTVADSAVPAPLAVPAMNQLLGQWNGPEGTYVLVAGSSGRYAITIRNLDGARTFQGSAAGAGIAFERDGKRQVLHATDGAATGMKWLAGKKHCVTIAPGEGYCRD